MDRVGPGGHLLIVGASGRAAARSAVRGRWSPIIVDAFADADTARIGTTHRIPEFPDGLVRLRDAFPPTEWMYVGGMENTPPLVAWWNARHRLRGTAPEDLARVRDPWQVERCLREAGLAVPRLCDGASPPESGRYLRKPRRSGGGLGILVHSPEAGIQAPAGDPDLCYFQERIAGRSYAAIYVANGRDAALLGLTRQWIGRTAWGASGYQYSGSRTVDRWPCSEDHINAVGKQLAKSFRLQGVFGVDLIAHRGRMFVVEVNPRYTASCELLERRMSASVVAMHMDACRNSNLPTSERRPDESHRRQYHFGKAVLYARSTLSGVPADPVNRLLKQGASRDWPPSADIPAEGSYVAVGHPILTLFAAARNAARIRARLDRRANRVEQWLRRVGT
ncbi:MAG: ATP-grasp domain-containing protein [Planctomycetes bacterium]|nr:ATP-grasp domain-containing protein [Planctomycetota bacterium]